MHTPRKAHIDNNITNNEFISLTVQQLFSSVNTEFLQRQRGKGHTCSIRVPPNVSMVLRSQELASFCINSATSSVWEPNLTSFMICHNCSRIIFNEIKILTD